MPAKVAVVTGSNKGIGLAIVRSLCSKFDGDVYLTSRNEERGHEAVKQLESEGLKLKYHQLDIDDMESITRLKNDIVSVYGGIDVLINNAGIAFKTVDKTPFSVQATVIMKTNYFSTLNISKAFLPHFKPNGRLVNLASSLSQWGLEKCSSALQKVFRSDTITEEELTAKMNEFVSAAQDNSHVKHGWPDMAYAVTKVGVMVMTRIHARMLREQGRNDILVNAADPGWVKTDMAGPKATKTPDQGAESSVYLALLPNGTTEPHGQFVSDKGVQPW